MVRLRETQMDCLPALITWRWFPVLQPAAVYPACAGIDLDDVIVGGVGVRLPRMRGDRPYWIFANR